MEDKYMMDNHKLLWHLDRICQWQRGERIAPLHIDLGITTGCNLGCVYCYGVLQGRDSAGQRFDMPKEALLRLLRDAKDIGVRSIAFIGEGENTLNEALYDGLSFAKDIDIDVSIATNGIKVVPERLKEVLEAVKWLRFNISAAGPGSYRTVHRANAFDRVLDNIQAAVVVKHKYRMLTAIGLQMVVVQDNIPDIVPLAKLGKELGVDYLVVKPCSDTYDGVMRTPHEKYLEIEDLMQEAENYSSEKYIVSVKWKKMKNLGGKPFARCYGTPFLLQISGEGTVFPCGHFFDMRREEFTMGNIIESSLKEVVASKMYWEVQNRIQSVNVNKDCETNCRHYYISQFLWDLKNPPEHVNFI